MGEKSWRFSEILEKAKSREGGFLILIAILIGISAGCAFLFFQWLINSLSHLFLGSSTDNSVAAYRKLPWHLRFLLPLSGVFISGFIIRFISRESGGAGIGLLLKTIKIKNGILPALMIPFKAVTSALSIATGVPLGSEGPIIMIGAAIGSNFGRLLAMSIARIKLLVGCGAAAGIAVAFNAPIAGTILAVETVLGNFAIGTLTPIVVAAATASFFGAYFLPGHEVIPRAALALSTPISSLTEIILFIAFGLLNAFLGVGLIRLTFHNANLFDRIKQKMPEYLHIPLLLLPFALVVPFVPELFGLGKDMMIAGNSFSPQFLIAIALLKLFFLSIAFASGASGGLFFPILFVGYVFGLGFGKLVPLLFPSIDPAIGLSFASVGIGALLGAATQEPISSLLIVFEITRDYNMLPSLMLATVVATLLSKSMNRFSIYNYRLYKEGISLEENEEASIMSENHVQLCLKKAFVSAPPEEELASIIERMKSQESFNCFVLDEQGAYLGTINGVFGAGGAELLSKSGRPTLARDLLDPAFPSVSLHTPLTTVIRLMIKRGVIELPVLDQENKLLGSIHEHDIIDFYHREILAKSTLLKTVRRIEGTEHQHIELTDEYRIEALNSTPRMWGKSLIELKLREKYNVLVLAVKGKGESRSVISPQRVLRPGDQLIAAGTAEDLLHCRREN